MQNTIFNEISDTWWDENGPYKALHWLTPLRMAYLSKMVDFESCSHVLDVGCGGGLMTIPLARKGLRVCGVDQTLGSLESARAKAASEGLEIGFYSELKDLPEKKFDLILLLEVLEHVSSPEQLILDIKDYLAPSGKLVISTLNRTMMSYLLGIVVAEEVLKWAPRGIHNWSDFIKPSELIIILERQGFKILDLQGYEYSLFSQKWVFGENLNINYFLTAQL
jgi:2-polyprenyl-6-hydroxyphenyl methylase/3-demethylubiquinone-9 3-methyltransferase